MRKKVDSRGLRLVRRVVDIEGLTTVSVYTSGDYLIIFDASGEIIGKIDAASIGWKMGSNVIIVEANGAGDHTTITAGLAAASANDVVWVMGGTYQFGTTITITANVHVRGLGRQATILEYTGTGVSFIIPDGSLTVIEDLTIYNRQNNNSATNTGISTSSYGSCAFRLNNVELSVTNQGTSGDALGIDLTDSNEVALYDVDMTITASNDATGINDDSLSGVDMWGGSIIITPIGGTGVGMAMSGTGDVELHNMPSIENNITGSPTIAGVWIDPTSGIYMVGRPLFLDADADSYLDSPSDDVIDVFIGGSEVAQFDATGIVLATASNDVHPDEGIGLIDRFDYRYVVAPHEHFEGGSLPSGWAWAGSPFSGTPNNVDYANSAYPSQVLIQDDTTAGQFFLYKTADTAETRLWAKVATNINQAGRYGGLRWDDGTTNNFVEIVLYVYSSTTWSIRLRYQIGGGGVSTVDSNVEYTAPPYMIGLNATGTQWSSWQVNGMTPAMDIGQYAVWRMVSGGGGWSWTPSRMGLVFDMNAVAWHLWTVDLFGYRP